MTQTTLPDSFAPTHGSWVAWWLPPLLGLVLVVLAMLRRRGALDRVPPATVRRATWFSRAALGVVVALSVGNYVDFGLMRYGTYLNEWASFHYFLGSKYARELGYTHLYDVAAVAAIEAGEPPSELGGGIRDLESANLVSIRTAVEHGSAIKRRFSRERWRDFVSDVRFFRSQLPPARWALIFQDHGYNATPVWSMVVASTLTSHLSIRDAVSRAILVGVDPLLLAVAFAAVAWAFRPRVAAWTLVLLGTHYLMSWGHMKGMIARTDFCVCTLLSVCLVEKRRFAAAGVLLAWASMSRVFPVLFLVGPGIQWLDAIRRTRSVRHEWTPFFAAYAGTVLVFIGLSGIYFGGTGIWHGWVAKILQHYAIRTDWNIGYQVLVDTDFVRGVPNVVHVPTAYANDEVARITRSVTLWATRLAVCVPAAYFTRNMRKSDALSFGFVFVFMLVSGAYYYYIILLVPFLYVARRVDQLSGAVGTALFLTTGSLGYLLFSGFAPLRRAVPMLAGHHQSYATYYGMTALIGVTVIAMLVIAGREAHAHETATSTIVP